MWRIRKLNNYATKFAIFCSGIGTSTESSSAFIIESNILRIPFLKALLGSWRNLSCKGFYSLAPDRTKDPRFWLSLEVLISKITRGRGICQIKNLFSGTKFINFYTCQPKGNAKQKRIEATKCNTEWHDIDVNYGVCWKVYLKRRDTAENLWKCLEVLTYIFVLENIQMQRKVTQLMCRQRTVHTLFETS